MDQNQILSKIPTPKDFAAFTNIDLSNAELVAQPLYDYQIYATAGTTQMSFFQTPIGGGVTSSLGATVGAVKSQADTNMELGGQLPQGKAFWCNAIGINFEAGGSASANTFIQIQPDVFNAIAGAALLDQLADINALRMSGYLEFNISSKNYLLDGPLGKFPFPNHLGVSAAVASNSATTAALAVVQGWFDGPLYNLDVPIVLPSGVNFGVNLKWPGVVATPSGFNGRIGVVLYGYLLRAKQ